VSGVVEGQGFSRDRVVHGSQGYGGQGLGPGSSRDLGPRSGPTLVAKPPVRNREGVEVAGSPGYGYQGVGPTPREAAWFAKPPEAADWSFGRQGDLAVPGGQDQRGTHPQGSGLSGGNREGEENRGLPQRGQNPHTPYMRKEGREITKHASPRATGHPVLLDGDGHVVMGGCQFRAVEESGGKFCLIPEDEARTVAAGWSEQQRTLEQSERVEDAWSVQQASPARDDVDVWEGERANGEKGGYATPRRLGEQQGLNVTPGGTPVPAWPPPESPGPSCPSFPGHPSSHDYPPPQVFRPNSQC
jgi:hypothetical protein